MALGYVGVDAETIKQTYEYSIKDNVIIGNYNFGEIKSELGMGSALSEKHHILLAQSVVVEKSKFDKIINDAFNNYLSSGGQDIIDGRSEALEKHMD